MEEVRTVAAPMKGLQAEQAAQSLSDHRPFHGMKSARTEEAGRWINGDAVGHHVSIWIAEVPGDHVHFGVDVAGSAGGNACGGKFGIVKKTAALANRRRT